MIKSIELKNFAQFKTHKIGDPNHGVCLERGLVNISGGNGSGKSNLFAAISIALGAQRVGGREYHQYVRHGEQRAEIELVIDNTFNNVMGRRPLHIYDTDEVVIECALTRDRRSYHVNGRPIRTISEYREMLKLANIDPDNELMFVEQNKINSICEKYPHQLLYALEVPMGVRDARIRYDKARNDYDSAEEEYKKLEIEVRSLESEVDSIEEKVRVFRQRKKLLEEKESLEREARVSKYYDLEEKVQSHKEEVKKIENEILEMEGRQENSKNERNELRVEIKRANESYEKLSKKEEEKVRVKGRIDSKLGGLLQRTVEVKSGIDEIEKRGPRPTGNLEEMMEELNRKLIERNSNLAKLESSLKEIERVVSLAKAKRRSYPDVVMRFIEELDSLGIEHLILGEAITITDPEWQLAIESILGPNRFNIVIPARNRLLETKQVADRIGYPHYVQAPFVSERQPLSEGYRYAIDIIDIRDRRVSGWIHEFLGDVVLADSIEEGDSLMNQGLRSITRTGYFQDRIGGISKRIGEDELVCGEQARLMRLEALRRREKELLLDKDETTHVVEETESELTLTSEWLGRSFLDEELTKLKEEAFNEKERLESVEKELNNVRKQRKKEKEKSEVGMRELGVLERELQFCEEKIRSLQAKQTKISKEVQRDERVLRGLQHEVEGILEPYSKGSLKSPAEYEGEIRVLTLKLSEYPKDLDSKIEGVYQNKKREYDTQSAEFEERKTNRVEWTERYEREREHFNMHVKRQVEIANREYKEILKRIVAEGSVELRESAKGIELWVFAQFKDKKRGPMHDKMHSGGERTAIALAILLALQRANASPFYMLDEFDMHLDEVRGQEYMELFGRGTGVQYFVISPRRLSVSSVVQAIYLINEKGVTKAVIMVPSRIPGGQTSLEIERERNEMQMR